MTHPSKSRIRQSFERAAPTYDGAAAVQRGICDQLLANLPNDTRHVHRVLDAGCGTGYALPRFAERFPAAQLLALDFSAAMLSRVGPASQRVRADLEHLPLRDACVDLYWSSLAVQWCALDQTLREARRVLAPEGQLALASLGPCTFSELRHAFADIDRHVHTLTFHSKEKIAQIALAAGFSAVDLHSGIKTVFYPDFRTLLRAVKAVGANQLGSGRRASLLGKTAFQHAEAAIETLRTPDGLPLSYDVIYLYART